jgi:ferredoxin-type protein NapF
MTTFTEFNPTAMAAISRMQFLRGDFTRQEVPLRPPWAVDELLFTELCNSCGDCISHCPTHIIQQGKDQLPVIDFTSGECVFCGDCMTTCKPRALKEISGQKPWFVKACIDTGKCISFRNIECHSCYDTCEADAIKMRPRVGGVSVPVLNSTSCTGCGACFSGCPSQAISMKNNTWN